MPTKHKNNSAGRFSLVSIFEKIANTPLLIEQYPLDMMLAVLSGKVGTAIFDESGSELSTKDWNGSARALDKYSVIEDGSAIIPVQGKLAHRHYGINAESGIQSYSGVLTQMDAALSDKSVKRVVFNIDTPGGEATGAFEAASQIFKARGEKPLIALVNESATSAGYLLASACDKIYMNNTSRVGSVGVIARVIDFRKAEEKEGLKSYVVYAGEGKDRLANSTISEKELEWLQTKLDETYSTFVEAVSAYRPQLTEDNLRKYGAEVFVGKAAVEAGYADGIISVMDFLRSPTAAIDEMAKASNNGADEGVVIIPKTQQENKKMSTKLEQCLSDALGFSLTGDEQADVKLANEALGNLKIAKKEDLDAEISKAVEAAVSEVKAEMQSKLDEANLSALSAEADTFVSKLESDGKLPASKREWAVKKYMADKDSFVEFMSEMAPMIPVGKDGKVATPPETPIKTDAQSTEKAELRTQLVGMGYSEAQVEKAVAAAFAD